MACSSIVETIAQASGFNCNSYHFAFFCAISVDMDSRFICEHAVFSLSIMGVYCARVISA
jgi:hypothetical protein